MCRGTRWNCTKLAWNPSQYFSNYILLATNDKIGQSLNILSEDIAGITSLDILDLLLVKLVPETENYTITRSCQSLVRKSCLQNWFLETIFTYDIFISRATKPIWVVRSNKVHNCVQRCNCFEKTCVVSLSHKLKFANPNIFAT